jgi:hypothetical protein
VRCFRTTSRLNFFDAITAHVDETLSYVDEIIAYVDATISHVDAIISRIDAISSHVGAIISRIGAISSYVDAIISRVDAIHPFILAIGKLIKKISQKLDEMKIVFLTLNKKVVMFKFYIKETFELVGRKPTYRTFINMGMSRDTGHNLLYNKSKSIKLKALFDICNFLQCTPNDLFTMSEQDYNGLYKDHPMRKLKKPTHRHSPVSLAKCIPVDRMDEANELLLDFLNNKNNQETDEEQE